MLINRFKEKGFSLPEVLVGLGLMGGISIVTMKMVENQVSNDVLIKSKVEVSKTVSIIEGIIANPDLCKKMLGGKIRATSTTSGTPLTDLKYTVNGGNIMVLENKNYGAFMINAGDIQLANSKNTSGGTFADLLINFRVRKKAVARFGDNTDMSNFTVVPARIPVSVTLNAATSAIESCGPVVSEANDTARRIFCQNLGGATSWVLESGVWKCKLKTTLKCPAGQLPKRMTSLGYVECVPAENAVDLDQIFDTSPGCATGTGQYKIEFDSGTNKLKLRCI